jgi:hypothetical protein
MKLIVVSSILILFRTADVAFGSGIIPGSGSGLLGSDADDAAVERKLEVSVSVINYSYQ